MNNIHQLLMIGIRGAELSEKEKQFLKDYSPGGIILFSRNIIAADQVAALCSEIKSSCRIPPFIGIDQEGGLVSRLRSIIGDTPTPTRLAQIGDPGQIERFGLLSSKTLASLGINLNFAPMVDIEQNKANNALPERYWGKTSDEVTTNAALFLKGMSGAGVLGCLKHFPGLGKTEVDSHFELPLNNATKAELLNEDLRPYLALHKEVDFVMIAHCLFPQIYRERIPSSVHPEIYRLLREEICFDGLTITDDLGMEAIANEYSTEEIIAKAVIAGADILPFCNDFQVIEDSFGIIAKLQSSGIFEALKIDEALARIARVKNKLANSENTDQTASNFPDAKHEIESFMKLTT